MLTSILFDASGSKEVSALGPAARKLSNRTVLWVNLQDASPEEIREAQEAFAIADQDLVPSQSSTPQPRVLLHDDYIHTSVLFAPDENSRSIDSAQTLNCYVGRNWLVTQYESANDTVDEFRELATGAGEIGGLEAMSLLATLLELVVVGYSEAFEDIEEQLERLDEKVLASKDREIESKVTVLVQARARVGLLRRTLAPHRRVFTTLSHAELDTVSTERSALRFTHLAEQVGEALNGARDAREAVVNSFDMLILRTEHRTNEIVKVLTLTSILFLPGALVAAIMGMNVNISASEFASSGLFWGSLVVIAAIAAGTLVLAKIRHWI